MVYCDCRPVRSETNTIGKNQTNVEDKGGVARFPHDPVGLLEDGLEQAHARKAAAAVVVLVDGEGKLWFDCAGYHKKDVLWALERMKLELLTPKD